MRLSYRTDLCLFSLGRKRKRPDNTEENVAPKPKKQKISQSDASNQTKEARKISFSENWKKLQVQRVRM
jgi:hypothetical protein